MCVFTSKIWFLDPDLKSTLKFREWCVPGFFFAFASVSAVGRVCWLFLKKKKRKEKKRSQQFAGTCLCLWGRIHRSVSVILRRCRVKTGDQVEGFAFGGGCTVLENVAPLSIQRTPDKGQLNPQFVPSGPPATWLVEGFGPNLAPTVMTWTSSVVEGLCGPGRGEGGHFMVATHTKK